MFCECGCGRLAPIATQTSKRWGWVAGQPKRFIVGHNGRMQERTSGYRMLRLPEHPRASSNGYVLEHIVIAEVALGHPLPPKAEIHHVDENTLNNAKANLVICQDREYHDLLHVRAKVLRAGGDPNRQRICGACRRPKDFADFNVSRSNKNGGVTQRCRGCNVAYCRSRRSRSVAA